MKVIKGESLIHGKGLFAKDLIIPGELVGRFEGKQTIENHTHVLWYEDDEGWQGLEVSNILKYANHSNIPNVEVIGIEMYALTTIRPGDEITFHYGEEWDRAVD